MTTVSPPETSFPFPILGEVDFGHFTVNIPMIDGIKVEFDTQKLELKYLEGVVS